MAFDQLGKEKGAEMQQVRWTEKGRERDEQVRNLFEKVADVEHVQK